MKKRIILGIVLLLSASVSTIAISPVRVSASESAISPGRYIVMMHEGVDAAAVLEDHGVDANSADFFELSRPTVSADLSSAVASSLRSDSRVVSMEPEAIARTQVVQSSGPGALAIPWGLDRIDQRALPASGTYSYTSTGAGVKAYIVDSGIKGDHVQFTGRVGSGWSYRAEPQADIDDWEFFLGSCKDLPGYSAAEHPYDVDVFDWTRVPGDVGSPDNDGHGTHVAGIVGGTDTGVAKGVTLVPVRVLNSCGDGATSMILRGLEWILADHQAGQPAVVNMSLGFGSISTVIDDALTALMDEGVIVVAAAGNEATSSCFTTPAGTPGTFSVGASDSADEEADYTNFGACVDIFAPGSNILSAWHYNGPDVNPYELLYGTSMASPHVAGVVARYLQGKTVTATTPDDAWTWLSTNATTGEITYFDPGRLSQTPNRLVAMVVPDSVSGVGVVAGDHQLTASWTPVVDTTYTVTATPGGATCTTSGGSCTISSLLNGVSYSLSIVGENSYGTGLATTTSGTPVGVPEPVANLVASPSNHALVISWTQPATEPSGIVYSATAVPGGGSCVTTTKSCTISGLTNGVTYTVTVTGTDTHGTSSNVTTTGTPDGSLASPTGLKAGVLTSGMLVSWTAIPKVSNVTYTVTTSRSGPTCVTTATSCRIMGLTNGLVYTFTLSARTEKGHATATSPTVSARPGFIVRKTSVKKSSRTLLSSLVVSTSNGTKRWSETGACSISGGRLVAPNKRTTCTVTLRVAKRGKYPAMSVKFSLRVT